MDDINMLQDIKVVKNFVDQIYEDLDLLLIHDKNNPALKGLYSTYKEKIIVPTIYEDISLYQNKIFIAEGQDWYIRLLNLEGKNVYDYISCIDDNKLHIGEEISFQGYCPTKGCPSNLILQDCSGMWGVYDINNDSEVLPYLFDAIYEVGNKMYFAEGDSQYGLVDFEGNILKTSYNEKDLVEYALGKVLFDKYKKKIIKK